MLAGAARGDTVDLGSGQIRGRVLRVLLKGSRPEWSVAGSGVRLSNGVILDGIDFEGCSVSVPLRLSDIRIIAGPHAAVLLRDAHIKRLGMQNRHLEGPLVADCAQIDNGVSIAGGNIDGQILVRWAQVGGASSVD